MFEAHQQFGNKWTEITKMFHGRTDNDIKNHFYSMLRRSLRRINKLLGRKNSTQKIKVIKPSVLSKIFGNIGVNDHKKSQQCKSTALFTQEYLRLFMNFPSPSPNLTRLIAQTTKKRKDLNSLSSVSVVISIQLNTKRVIRA